MSKITRLGFLTAVALTLPFTAGAQHGGVVVGAAAPAAPAAAPARAAHPSTSSTSAHPHRVSPTAPSTVHGTGTLHHASATNTTTTNTVGANPNVVVINSETGLPIEDLTGQVPGLGFDYEHLAAISGNLAEKALIDPVTREELALAEQFNRGVGGAAYILGGYGATVPVGYDNSDAQPDAAPEPAPAPPPQIIIVQPPAAPSAQAYDQTEPRAERMKPVPLPEASDFLLVLKNGAMISAVAFTRQGDQLVYVTKEGNRRTMSVAGIDSDATSKINEARGTPLKLSI